MQPPQADVLEAVGLLQSLRDPSSTAHQAALRALDRCTNPRGACPLAAETSGAAQQQLPQELLAQTASFARAVACVFSTPTDSSNVPVDLRQLAGIIIKNNIVKIVLDLDAETVLFLKQSVVQALTDPSSDIRGAAGSIVGKLADSYTLPHWVDIMGPLVQLIAIPGGGSGSESLDGLDGALLAVTRVCEDSPEKLCMDLGTHPALLHLVPRLLALLAYRGPSTFVRVRPLHAINSMLFLCSSCGALAAQLPALVAALGDTASDPDPAVRKAVCQTIGLLVTFSPDVLNLKSGDVCKFMLSASRDLDDGVVFEACEFWSCLVGDYILYEFVFPYLGALLPALLLRLRLSAEQVAQERADEQAEHRGDQAAMSKMHVLRIKRSSASEESRKEAEAEATARWTLRKQCAYLLDTIAATYPPDAVVPSAMPAALSLLALVDDAAARRDHGCDAVWVRESGILAFGAMSSGCLHSPLMDAYLPQMYSFLLQSLSDPTPELRATACWAISRYIGWVLGDGPTPREEIFSGVVAHLLHSLVDPAPRVQSAALSALCGVYEAASGEGQLICMVPHILQCYKQAAGLYGVKNSLLLLDNIGSLSEAVGDALADPQLTPMYMPLVMQYFAALEDFDYRLVPLLECLSSLGPCMQVEIAPFAAPILDRCLRLVETALRLHNESDAKVSRARHEHAQRLQEGGSGSDDEYDYDPDDLPSKDFVVSALDVVCGLCEGLGGAFATLVVAQSDTSQRLLTALGGCCKDIVPEVRQSALSLAGEISRRNLSLLAPMLQAGFYVEMLAANMDASHPYVCNNACWCIGELALQAGPQGMQGAGGLIHRLSSILREVEGPASMRQNAAIAIGRLALVNTADVAGSMHEYFALWCQALGTVQHPHERDEAFSGLLSALQHRPDALFEVSDDPFATAAGDAAVLFNSLCLVGAVARAFDESPPDPLGSTIRACLHHIVTSAPKPMTWQAIQAATDRRLLSRLKEVFRIN